MQEDTKPPAYPVQPFALKAMLLLVSSLTVMAGATIAPSLPQMVKVFQDVPQAEFLSKLLLTLPALMIALSAPFTGSLADRFGRLRVLVPAMLLYGLAGSAGFLLDSLYLILVTRALLGLAVAGIMTVVIALIGDYFEGKTRIRFLGIQGAFMSLGGAVFVGIGGGLADLGWRYPFLLYLFPFLLLPFVLRVLYEPEITDKGHSERASFKRTLERIGLVLLIAFLGMLTFYMLPVQLPFLMKNLGITANSYAGIALAVATLTSAFMGFFYGRLRERFGPDRIFIVLFILMGTGFLIVSQSQTFAMLLIAMAITGFGMGMLMPNLNTWLLRLAGPQERGKFTGWLSTALFMGQFFSPILAVPIIAPLGIEGLFAIGGLILLSLSAYFSIRVLQRKTSD